MQRAQPVLAVHYWLAYCEKLERDWQRLSDCRLRVNQLTLGTAALAGTTIPITVIKNGDGPTALLVGGNHGGEYEGPVALLKLTQELRADDIQGRVIILPALNLPAVLAGQRVSPVDGLDMNRSSRIPEITFA